MPKVIGSLSEHPLRRSTLYCRVWIRRCCWCSKPFVWSREKGSRPKARSCSHRCASKARTISLPDDHWKRMQQKSAASRRRSA